MILNIPTARVFRPLLGRARYKGAHGGRGSGKSHFFAEHLVERAMSEPGLRAVCIREVQKTLAQSAKKLIEDKIQQHGLGAYFQVMDDKIKTPGGGVIIFQGMQDHTAESIKSLEGFDIAWVEEAQTISKTSLKLLRPTIRKPGSEIWFSWNPRLKTDPVDVLMREKTPTGAVVVEANWNDNPWFPAELEQERLDCLRDDPDEYEHIWEGGYVTYIEGAYFKNHLAAARREGRISRVGRDPSFIHRVFVDIGGTGASSDNFVMWVAQFIGKSINVIDHYEVQGQDFAAHQTWLWENDYEPGNTKIWLPHDGSTYDKVFNVSYESAFRKAGYPVVVVPNQGKGAAMTRIAQARRLWPRIWIDKARCDTGIQAMEWYHEKKDENRNVGLGPEHDWASHSADAFGLMCVAYEEPRTQQDMAEFRRTRQSSNWRTA